MSIGVQSYPELYTMLIGWGLYDKLWDLLTKTGVAYLPFIGMIFKNITHSYEMQGEFDAGPSSLRRMEINIIITIFLILFAASPCIPLSERAVSYTPICGIDQGNTFYPGDTNTSYDKAFAVPTDNIYVPIWWYAVISVSEGVTHAANTMISCVPDLRKMVTTVDMTQITDPEIKQELQDFQTMCFMPAKIQYNQDKQTNNEKHLDRVSDDVNEYGAEDTEWLGSHGFSDVYYRNLKASRPIPGFAYDASDDINADVNDKAPPAFSAPNCNEWWNHYENGLKNRLYQSLPKSFIDEFKDLVSEEKVHDDVIKRIISNATDGYDNANTTMGEGGYSHVISSLGIWAHQMEEYPKLYAASQAAPIMQALLLMMIYVFLPFALVFSSFKLSSFVSGAMLIFSVIFWGFIWHLISWTDNALMQALYSNWFSKQGAGATLADMIIASLVIFSPIFWFAFMGAMGIAIGDIVSSFSMGISKMGENVATKGTAIAQESAKTLGKAALL